MVKPIIYAGADTKYYNKFSTAFINSATVHGMSTIVENFGDVGHGAAFIRFCALPNLLKSHSAILLLDIDSIINAPIDIDDRSDLAIFFRPNNPCYNQKVLCSAFYITDRAMDFANDLAKKASETEKPQWMDDQVWIWEITRKYIDRYSIKALTTDFITWDQKPSLITTGKGGNKYAVWFRKRMRKYGNAAV